LTAGREHSRMGAMIVEYIRYEIEDAEALTRAYEVARHSLEASPHCLGYELSRCLEDPKWMLLRIEWDSTEGHLEGFRKSSDFGPFLESVRPFIGQIREMRHYELTSVVSRKA
jgi:quinol monooxygenase YgiN